MYGVMYRFTPPMLIACSCASARDAFSEYFILRLTFLSLNHKYQRFECLKLLFMHAASNHLQLYITASVHKRLQ